jgi:hypothetical protein
VTATLRALETTQTSPAVLTGERGGPVVGGVRRWGKIATPATYYGGWRMEKSGRPLNDTLTLFYKVAGSEIESITCSATLPTVGVRPEGVPLIECQRLAGSLAGSLRELAADPVFQLISKSYFFGGPPRVQLSTSDPESDDEQFEMLIFPTSLDAEVANSRLFSLLDEIESHGSALLRGAVLDVEYQPA